MRREALIYRAEYDSGKNTFSTYVVGTASDTRLYIFIPTPSLYPKHTFPQTQRSDKKFILDS